MSPLRMRTLTPGAREELDVSSRYFLQTAERAMRGNVVRGLVELVTNCDDSYGCLEERHLSIDGPIEVVIERKHKGRPATILVRDHAEGMAHEDMMTKLKRVGGITSQFIEAEGRRTRGLMGRGSRECVIFGSITFQSIKDGWVSAVRITREGNHVYFIPGKKQRVTSADRIELGIPRGNGTLVTLEVDTRRFRVPSHEFLLHNFAKYYSLRDIAASRTRRLLLRDRTSRNTTSDHLVYTPQIGPVEVDENFEIPGYPEARAHLVIQRSAQRIPMERTSPYWEGGILVKSSHAIHEVTGFHRDIENNPYFESYFGRLTCPYIDHLVIEYEKSARLKIPHTASNPVRIIDPLRDEGLAQDHPFTGTLYAAAAQRLQALLKRDEEQAKGRLREIENRRTTERLKKLAGEVSRYIREQTEDPETTSDEYYLTQSEIPAGGMVTVPGGARIPLGEERTFYVYAKPSVGTQEAVRRALLTARSPALKLNADAVGLAERADGILYGSFSVGGSALGTAIVTVRWGSVAKDLSVAVIESGHKAITIPDFGFEKTAYVVRQGKQKSMRIFAKYPEFVHGDVRINIEAENTEFFDVVTPRVWLRYMKLGDGQRAAIGTVRIAGKKEGGPAAIFARLQGTRASARVRVLPPSAVGHDIKIEIVNEDLGNQRAIWSGHILKIAGQHETIRRYLGPPESGFAGQDSVHFRLLIAELIAESVARRIMELNAQKNLHAFASMDVHAFYRQHRELMGAFLEIAHRIEVPDTEIRKLRKSTD